MGYFWVTFDIHLGYYQEIFGILLGQFKITGNGQIRFEMGCPHYSFGDLLSIDMKIGGLEDFLLSPTQLGFLVYFSE